MGLAVYRPVSALRLPIGALWSKSAIFAFNGKKFHGEFFSFFWLKFKILPISTLDTLVKIIALKSQKSYFWLWSLRLKTTSCFGKLHQNKPFFSLNFSEIRKILALQLIFYFIFLVRNTISTLFIWNTIE